jgi:hypothetical protein
MVTNDINLFKGKIKDAITSWAGGQIDQLLPNKVATRAILKNAVGNYLNKYSEDVDKGVDTVFLFLGDKEGNINSDTMVDTLCVMLEEMPPKNYCLGPFNATVGKGVIDIRLPGGFFSELVAGDLGGVKIATSDLKQIKNFLV